MPYVRSVRNRRSTGRRYYRRRYASRRTFPYRRIRNPMSVTTCMRKMTAIRSPTGFADLPGTDKYNIIKIDLQHFTSLTASNDPQMVGMLGLADGFNDFKTFYSQFRIAGVQFEINPIVRFTRAGQDITDQCKFEYIMGKQRCYPKMSEGQNVNDLQDPNTRKTISSSEKGSLVNKFYMSASTVSERTTWLNTNALVKLDNDFGYYYSDASGPNQDAVLPSGCFAPGFQLGIRITAPFNNTETTASYTYNITVTATFYLAFKGQINTTDADDGIDLP